MRNRDDGRNGHDYPCFQRNSTPFNACSWRLDCLHRMKELVKPNGYLVITTPFSWLDEFTQRENWLGGYEGKVHCCR